MENDIKNLLEEHQGKLEDRINDFKEEIKSHFGVVAESLEGKITLVAEQHTSIMKILEHHTQDIGAIKEEIVDMNIKLGHIENQLHRKVDHEEFGKVEKRVAILETGRR